MTEPDSNKAKGANEMIFEVFEGEMMIQRNKQQAQAQAINDASNNSDIDGSNVTDRPVAEMRNKRHEQAKRKRRKRKNGSNNIVRWR